MSKFPYVIFSISSPIYSLDFSEQLCMIVSFFLLGHKGPQQSEWEIYIIFMEIVWTDVRKCLATFFLSGKEYVWNNLNHLNDFPWSKCKYCCADFCGHCGAFERRAFLTMKYIFYIVMYIKIYDVDGKLAFSYIIRKFSEMFICLLVFWDMFCQIKHS